MAEIKDRLETDLVTAMRARDELTTATIRMVLAAVRTEEVAGKTQRQLTDAEVVAVVGREAKKRREAAEAFDHAGRVELAERERAEERVLDGYLPAQLTADELAGLVRDAVAESGATEPRQMGQVMKVLQPKIAGRAEGGRVAAEVKRQLAG